MQALHRKFLRNQRLGKIGVICFSGGQAVLLSMVRIEDRTGRTAQDCLSSTEADRALSKRSDLTIHELEKGGPELARIE